MSTNKSYDEGEYKLYKSVRDILHPTISKKNISNYSIVLDDSLIPLRVYYPKKMSNIYKIVIYVQGNLSVNDGKKEYSLVSKEFSFEFDTLVIRIPYYNDKSENDVYNTIKYIYQGLIRNNIDEEDILLIGDSKGSTVIMELFDKLKKSDINIHNSILFYPLLDRDNFDIERNNCPNTMIICGNTDPFISNVKKITESNNIELLVIPFASHGFLNTYDTDVYQECKNGILSFLGNG